MAQEELNFKKIIPVAIIVVAVIVLIAFCAACILSVQRAYCTCMLCSMHTVCAACMLRAYCVCSVHTACILRVHAVQHVRKAMQGGRSSVQGGIQAKALS